MIILQIVQKPPSLADHHKKTPSRVEVFGMPLQVVCKFFDSSCQQSNLDFRRTGIFAVDLKLFYDFLFLFLCECQLLLHLQYSIQRVVYHTVSPL